MSDSPYRVLGVGVPPMLGRDRFFERLCRHLTKPTPDHVSVIGPAKFGKSVLLNHLASHFRQPGMYFTTSMYWDLRHGAPATDHEFRRQLAEHVKRALRQVDSEYADFLEPEEDSLHDLLHLVFEEMHRKEIRFLAVLDGFDHVLKGSGITRNLWDELLSLCRMTSLRLVTGSRSRLRELCKTEESRTSDFWEIFYDTPLHVGCFEEHDWDGFLKPFESRGVKLDGSAKKEFANWTGGVPTLSAALAERLYSEVGDEITVSKTHVDSFATEISSNRRELLATLWDDCHIDVQSDLTALTKQDIPLSEMPPSRRRDLELRGFAHSSGKRIKSSCRLMDRYVQEQAAGVENLRRLFGNTKRFEANIRSLLELRLTQINGVDPKLLADVEKAIRDMHPEPTQSTTWARSIADRALDLIWDAELAPDRSLPDEWNVIGIAFDERGRLPGSRGRQCGILRQITGTEAHDPVAKFITRPTCMLVDHVHSVGNFGQHRRGITVSTSVAASFCLSAIALCESLAKDLATPANAAASEADQQADGPEAATHPE